MAGEKSEKTIRAAGQISQVKNKLKGGKPFKIIELSIPIRSGGLTGESRLLAEEYFESGTAVDITIAQSQKELDV